MKNYYIRTKFTYLLGSIPYFFFSWRMFKDWNIGKDNFFIIIVGVIYLFLLFACVIETYTARQKMKNIISNGHCVVGSVKKVLRQKRIVTFSKYHAMEEARCYRIVAEADDM